MRRRRVLLVEDNPADVRLLEEAATDVGMDAEISAVADGERALEHLRAAHDLPDLVLLDLNLPRRGGREVLAEIRRDERLRAIPVIVLSTSSAPRDVAESYACGANAYLVKPLGLEDFTEMVRTVDAFWLRLVQLPEAVT